MDYRNLSNTEQTLTKMHQKKLGFYIAPPLKSTKKVSHIFT